MKNSNILPLLLLAVVLFGCLGWVNVFTAPDSLSCFVYSSGNSENNVEHVLTPSVASALSQEITKPPLSVCGKPIEKININKDHVLITFGKEEVVVVKLVYPEKSLQQLFAVSLVGGNCDEAVGRISEVIGKMKIDNPWREVPIAVIDDNKQSVSAGHIKKIADGVDQSCMIVPGLFLCFALIVMCVFSAVIFYREKAYKRTILFLFLGALLVRLLPSGVNYNWYVLSTENLSCSTVRNILGSGFVWILYWVDRLTGSFFNTFDLLVNFNRVVSALTVPLVYLVVKRLETNRHIAFISALILLIWPLAIRFGASDSSHNLALLLWVCGALAYERALSVSKMYFLLALIMFISMPLVRIESVGWAAGWLMLAGNHAQRRKALWLLGAIALIAVIVAVFITGTLDGMSAEISISKYLLIPFTIFVGMGQSWILLPLLYFVVPMSCYLLWRNNKIRTLKKLLLGIFAVASPWLFFGNFGISNYTIRYTLPLLLIIIVMLAYFFAYFGNMIRRYMVYLSVPVILLCFIALGHDAYLSLTESQNYTFQNELVFLKRANRYFKPGDTLCMVNPGIAHSWGKNYYDLDTSFYPRFSGTEKFLGLNYKIRTMNTNDDDMKDCTAYYESSVCSLSEEEPNSVIRQMQISKIKKVCEIYNKRMQGKKIIDQQEVLGKNFNNILFSNSNVNLRIFDMQNQ